MLTRIAVMVSGGGTNLQALIDAQKNGILKNGEIVTRTGINEDLGWSRVEYDGQVLYYYGAYPVADSTWFFVRYDQNLCYVNSDGVSAPAISLHPTPITTAADVNPVQPTPDEQDPADQPIQQEPAAQSSDTLSKMQIAIIALVCIPAIIIVVVLFLPAKSKKQKYYTTDSAAADLPTETPSQPSQKPRYFDDFL